MKKFLLIGLTCAIYFVGVWKRPLMVPFSNQIPYLKLFFESGTKAEALAALEEIRKCSGYRFRVTSAYRNADKNKKVGGASHSVHLQGKAFDLIVPHALRSEFYLCAKKAKFKAFGWGNGTVHIDLGKRRWWTYDDQGHHVSGSKKYRYLNKAPKEFLRDFKIKKN